MICWLFSFAVSTRSLLIHPVLMKQKTKTKWETRIWWRIQNSKVAPWGWMIDFSPWKRENGSTVVCVDYDCIYILRVCLFLCVFVHKDKLWPFTFFQTYVYAENNFKNPCICVWLHAWVWLLVLAYVCFGVPEQIFLCACVSLLIHSVSLFPQIEVAELRRDGKETIGSRPTSHHRAWKYNMKLLFYSSKISLIINHFNLCI